MSPTTFHIVNKKLYNKLAQTINSYLIITVTYYIGRHDFIIRLHFNSPLHNLKKMASGLHIRCPNQRPYQDWVKDYWRGQWKHDLHKNQYHHQINSYNAPKRKRKSPIVLLSWVINQYDHHQIMQCTKINFNLYQLNKYQFVWNSNVKKKDRFGKN